MSSLLYDHGAPEQSTALLEKRFEVQEKRRRYPLPAELEKAVDWQDLLPCVLYVAPRFLGSGVELELVLQERSSQLLEVGIGSAHHSLGVLPKQLAAIVRKTS